MIHFLFEPTDSQEDKKLRFHKNRNDPLIFMTHPLLFMDHRWMSIHDPYPWIIYYLLFMNHCFLLLWPIPINCWLIDIINCKLSAIINSWTITKYLLLTIWTINYQLLTKTGNKYVIISLPAKPKKDATIHIYFDLKTTPESIHKRL